MEWKDIMGKPSEYITKVHDGISVAFPRKLSEELKNHLKAWEPFALDAMIILQEEVETQTSGGIRLPDGTITRQQMKIGRGWVISKSRDDLVDARLADIKIGDMVKFPAGTPISAEFPESVPEHRRVQILHIQNLIMIHRCGDVATDDLKCIQEEQYSDQSLDVDALAS